MSVRSVPLLLCVCACGLATNGRNEHLDVAREAPPPSHAPGGAGGEAGSSGSAGAPEPYSRQTDSATAHCYQQRPAEQATAASRFVGCWERRLAGGEQLSLSVGQNGYFYASLDGGDYSGSDFGRWEEFSGGVVLFPAEGECTLSGGVIGDACARLFDVDGDGAAIQLAGQASLDTIDEVTWQRGRECFSAEVALEKLTLDVSGCFPEALEPLEVVGARIDISPAENGPVRAAVEFALDADLRDVDLYDLQRRLSGSVRTFALRDPEGELAAQFIRHGLPTVPGDFFIGIGPARQRFTVAFVHELRALPRVLLLDYEFFDAKYVKDIGARSVTFPLAR